MELASFFDVSIRLSDIDLVYKTSSSRKYLEERFEKAAFTYAVYLLTYGKKMFDYFLLL